MNSQEYGAGGLLCEWVHSVSKYGNFKSNILRDPFCGTRQRGEREENGLWGILSSLALALTCVLAL